VFQTPAAVAAVYKLPVLDLHLYDFTKTATMLYC